MQKETHPQIQFIAFVLSAILISFQFLPVSSAAPKTNHQVPEGVQSRIVELFSHDKCSEVRDMIRPNDVSGLRPNVMAIVAYCEPPGVDADAVFKEAETLDPTGDLILTLHAKYQWKKDPKAAEPLWQRVIMLARNPYLVSMAHEYIDGLVTTDRPLSLSRTTLYGSILAGGSAESNAKLPDFAFAPSASSPTMNIQARLNAQHWFPQGSISSNYSLEVAQHFSASRYDLTAQELDIPVALHAGKNEDIAFRPLVGLTTVGSSLFQSKVGMGVLGIIYRPTYKQSIQGLVYTDHIFIPEIVGESATHYHFDYSWEFFPQYWLVTAQASIEHAAAVDSLSYAGVPGDFNNSHTDTGVAITVERNFRFLSVGLTSKIVARADSGSSSYTSRLTGAPLLKTREDSEISFQPNVTVPIIPYLHLFAWYEWHKLSSNVGAEDYVNRNYLDQVVGVALKTYLSSY